MDKQRLNESMNEWINSQKKKRSIWCYVFVYFGANVIYRFQITHDGPNFVPFVLFCVRVWQRIISIDFVFSDYSSNRS